MSARVGQTFFISSLLLVVSACGMGVQPLMSFDMTLQLISDCSQAGSGAIQCESLEDAAATKEMGVWFIEQKEGRTFILTNHKGEAIKGVGAFEEEAGLVYQARKYEEEVNTSDGCHTYQDELYDLVLVEDTFEGELTMAQTGGSELESADCGVLWAHEVKYLVKGTQRNEVVPARD